MKAESAIRLVRECKRNPRALTPYNDPLVRNALQEIGAHSEQMGLHAAAREDLGLIETEKMRQEECAALAHRETAQFNKRCLLAYHMHRARLVQQIAWEAGMLPGEVRKKLSGAEVQLYAEYEALIRGSYRKRFPDLDLFSAPTPPKELFVEVRVLRDCGQIYTESGGVVNLAPGAQLLVRRRDVEKFITMGYLKHLSTV